MGSLFVERFVLLLSAPSAPVPLLALVTTFHLALAALRNHKSRGTYPLSSLALVSAVLAGLPWMLPSTSGLIAGGLLHAAWFFVCERVTSASPAPSTSSARPSSPQASNPRRPAVSPAARPALTPGARGASTFIATPVLAVVDETPDIRTFRLKRPDAFMYEAGQFVPVRVKIDGKDHVRCYSISSAPEATGYIEISVKRQGLVSNALHAMVRPGASLFVREPAGAFTYPSTDDRPLVLIAGGVGITPLMSMLRHGVMANPGRPITLLYSARDAVDLAFGDELHTLARRHPQIRVAMTTTRGRGQGLTHGRIDRHLITTAAPELASSIVLMCGPQAMIDELRATLAALGLAESQVRSEYFEAAVAASTKLRQERDIGAGANVETIADEPANVVIQFTRSNRKVDACGRAMLLDVAERGGVEIPSLCRAGVCGTCRTRVVSGDVVCDADLLNANERDQGFVLACVACVVGDCAVEA